jgi:hypothetical protein
MKYQISAKIDSGKAEVTCFMNNEVTTFTFDGDENEAKKFIVLKYSEYSQFLISLFFDLTDEDSFDAIAVYPDSKLVKQLYHNWLSYNACWHLAFEIVRNQYRFKNLILDATDRFGRPIGRFTTHNHELFALIVKISHSVIAMMRKLNSDVHTVKTAA